jgi:hypothetical protein
MKKIVARSGLSCLNALIQFQTLSVVYGIMTGELVSDKTENQFTGSMYQYMEQLTQGMRRVRRLHFFGTLW